MFYSFKIGLKSKAISKQKNIPIKHISVPTKGKREYMYCFWFTFHCYRMFVVAAIFVGKFVYINVSMSAAPKIALVPAALVPASRYNYNVYKSNMNVCTKFQ